VALVKTEAIVLKSDNYREKSKILTLYTKSFGKLRTIAKGVRDTKSKWGGVLQSMAYLNIMVYLHEIKTLHLLSSAEYAIAFQSLPGDYEKMKIGFRIVEMVNRTTMDNHVIRGLFELLVSSLSALDSATKNYVNVLFYFEFKLAGLLGIAVNPDSIVQTAHAGKEISRALQPGKRGNPGSLNPKVPGNVLFTVKNAELLRIFASNRLEEIMNFELTGVSARFLDNFLDFHFREHFECIGNSKTKKVFNSKELHVK